MARFTVTLADNRIETIDHADAYQQEGPLTTFFSFAGGREVIDSWSARLASFRTADVVTVRRLTTDAVFAESATLEPDHSSDAFDEAPTAPLLRSA